jgi:hypothetical protein
MCATELAATVFQLIGTSRGLLACAVVITATKRWSLIDAAKAQFDAAQVRHTATLVSTALRDGVAF